MRRGVTSPSKRKGNTYEREIVEACNKVGLHALRAWGSNGKAIGKPEAVDVVIATKRGDVHVQAKRRASLPQYLCIPEGCHIVVTRQDNGSSMVLCPLDWVLELLKGD